MIYLSILSIMFSSWCALMIPKDAMDRPAWAYPKSKLYLIFGLSIVAGIVTGLLGKTYFLSVLCILIPFSIYWFSEHKEVKRLKKISGNSKKGDFDSFKLIVRRRK